MAETALEKVSRLFAQGLEHYEEQFANAQSYMRDEMMADLLRAAKEQVEAGLSGDDLHKWFHEGMRLAAQAEARTLVGRAGEVDQILVELYERLAEDVCSLAPKGYGTAWHVFPTDDGGWVEFVPSEVRDA